MEIDIDGKNLVSAKLFFDEPGDLLQLIQDHVEVYLCSDGRIMVDVDSGFCLPAFSLWDAAKWIAEGVPLTEEGLHLKLAQALEECASMVRDTGEATRKRGRQ